MQVIAILPFEREGSQFYFNIMTIVELVIHR